jgi:hypothetical protein
VTQKPDYVIERRDIGLVPEILDFFKKNPANGLREMDEKELAELVKKGLFFVARKGEGGPIVGTVYFSEQVKSGARREYEMGGGLVARKERQKGLIECLGVCAISAFRLESRRSAADASSPVAIVGRVEASNKTRIREVLTGLGFESAGTGLIDPGDKPGLTLMPKNKDGLVNVDEFIFDEAKLKDRVREAIKYRDTCALNDEGATVHVAVGSLNADDDGDPLREFLAELDSSHVPPASPDGR